MVRAVAAALLVAFAFLAWSAPASAQKRFYLASPEEIRGEPGTIIRQQEMPHPPTGATAYRVLYRSTGLDGEPIAVSGAIIVPTGPAPPGGRPVVAWAHPTTGVMPRCAPTLAMYLFQQIQGLHALIEKGFVVAATDYPGLGVPGPHPYLVGASEGRAVLDSVRAARMLHGSGAGSRFAVWGHSQGGQAALFSGLLAAEYAPELSLVGVAAAAPATELATLMTDDFETTAGKNLTAMTLWSWARVFGAPIDRVVEPSAMPAVDELAEACIESIYDLAVRRGPGKDLQDRILSVDKLADIEPWRTLLKSNTPAPLPARIPLFLAQGLGDELVRPPVTEDYKARTCQGGGAVRLMLMPGVDHGFAGREAASAAVAWMADRFAGVPPPSDC